MDQLALRLVKCCTSKTSFFTRDVATYEPLATHRLRRAPPITQPEMLEVDWFECHQEFGQLGNLSSSSQIKCLLAQACTTPLIPTHQQKLLLIVESNMHMLLQCGLEPSIIPGIVENNPIIAIECLIKIIHETEREEYLYSLVDMSVSLHCMEVVNRLSTEIDLPPGFIHLFISNCIATCESMSDKYMQNRLVRLVCVFLQSLIRNRIVDVHDLIIEVQAFCIEFSR